MSMSADPLPSACDWPTERFLPLFDLAHGDQSPDVPSAMKDIFEAIWKYDHRVYAGGETNPFFMLEDQSFMLPNKPALFWLDKQGNTETMLTYKTFLAKIRGVARLLTSPEVGLTRGDRALLCYEPGLEFLTAFWACLACGVIAVPVCPPDPFNPKSDVADKADAIIKDTGVRVFLSSSQYLHAVKSARIYGGGSTEGSGTNNTGVDPSLKSTLQVLDREWVHTDKASPATPEEFPIHRTPESTNPNAVAFLQYTSGSTGQAKGVMVSHRNLVVNSSMCLQMTHSTDTWEDLLKTVAVSWLPTFHDMGLIGFHISLAMGGGTLVAFSPLDFIQDPLLWLRVIGRYRRVVSGGPPFALELCARRVAASKVPLSFDLSPLAALVLGAEPIQPEVLDRFTEVMSPHGFKSNVFLPCYGLAENVLFVTGKQSVCMPPVRLAVDRARLQAGENARVVEVKEPARGQNTRACKWLLSSGDLRPVDAPWLQSSVQVKGAIDRDVVVRIVDHLTKIECEDGVIGEIWVAGASKTRGYWNRADLTAETFEVCIAESSNPLSTALVQKRTEFLRTGDLGTVLHQQLYITGRLKDMVIINGVNYYPSDIETAVAAADASIKPGCVVATSLESDGKEELMVLIELRDPRKARVSACKKVTQSTMLALAQTMPYSLTYGALHAWKWIQAGMRAFTGSGGRRTSSSGEGSSEHPQSSRDTAENQSEILANTHAVTDEYTDSELRSTLSSVRRTVVQQFGLPVTHVALLTPKSLKKTSSGKLQRTATRRAWIDGELAARVVAEWASKRHNSKAAGRRASSLPTVPERDREQTREEEEESEWDEEEHVEVEEDEGEREVGAGEEKEHTGVDETSEAYKEEMEATKKVILAIVLEELGDDVVHTGPENGDSDGNRSTTSATTSSAPSSSSSGGIVADGTSTVVPSDAESETTVSTESTVKHSTEGIVAAEAGSTVADLLKGPDFDHDTPLDDYGLDSLTGTRLAARLTEEFELPQQLSVFMFINEPTLNGVAKVVLRLRRSKLVHDESSKGSSAVPSDFQSPKRLPCILGIGCQTPTLGGPQEGVMERLCVPQRLSGKAKAMWFKIGKGSKINWRHTVLPSAEAMFWGREGCGNDASMEERNAVFKNEAPKLAMAAATKAISDWGGDKKDITHVVAVTCTGVIIPGLEFHIMQGLGLSTSTQRLSIQFMGCFGALSGLKAAKALAVERTSNRVLVVCCELCSLHMQMNEKIDNMVANAIFADGAGAFVVGVNPKGKERAVFEIYKDQSYIIPDTLPMMKWELTQTGLIIGLSKHISGEIYKHISAFCDQLLAAPTKSGRKARRVSRADCTWAIHPGGPMIIKAIEDCLRVDPEDTKAAWEVLRDNGNMSSATLVFLWDALRKKDLSKKPWIPAFAFGPGLNVEGALLRAV